MLKLVVLFSLFLGALLQTPVMFDKYYANVTHYIDEQGDTIPEFFYVNSKEGLGLGIEKTENYDMSVYHIDKDDPTHSYMVLSQGSEISCFLEEISIKGIDILMFITSSVESFVETRKCGSIDCNVFKMKGDGLYFAIKDTGVPYKVIDSKKNPQFDFLEFKSGDESFDEKTKFKLPVDPSTCSSESHVEK